MNLASKVWKSVRRNPVINAFLLAMLAQFAHDYFAKQVDWTNIVGYVAMVFIGVATRMFTVPEKEHAEVTAHRDTLAEDLNRLLRTVHKDDSVRKGDVN